MRHGDEVQIKKHGNKSWIKRYFTNSIMSLFSIRKPAKRNGDDDAHIDVKLKNIKTGEKNNG